MCVVISAMVFVNHYLAFDFFSSVWYPFSEVQFLFVAFLCVLFLLQAEMLVDTHKSLYPYNFPLLCTKWDTLKKKRVFVGEPRWYLPPMWPRFEPPDRRHNTWVQFVVGSLPCLSRRGFLQLFRFSLLLKNQHFQMQI